MWFEVHGCGLSDIDATLLNEPFNVSRLKAGERGRHDLDVMTDWTIMTPCGTITPRAMQAARFLRNNREEILKVLAENRPERQS